MQWNANFYDFSFLLFSVAVLLKLSQSIYKDRKIRKICLPVMRYQYPQSLDEGQDDLLTNMISRNFQMTVSLCVADYALKRSIHLYFLLSVQLQQPQRRRGHGRQRKNDRFLRFKDDVRTMGDGSITDSKSNLMPSMVSCTIFPNYSSDWHLRRWKIQFQLSNAMETMEINPIYLPQDLPYFDCIATGWGKSTSNENLTDTLYKTRVLIVDNKR